MKENYRNLSELLSHSSAAEAYFSDLPESIRRKAEECGGMIHSQHALRRMAEQWRGEGLS